MAQYTHVKLVNKALSIFPLQQLEPCTQQDYIINVLNKTWQSVSDIQNNIEQIYKIKIPLDSIRRIVRELFIKGMIKKHTSYHNAFWKLK